MSIWKDLQYNFKTSSIAQQLIYINIAVFVITLVTGSFSGLYGERTSFIMEWFSLSSSLDVWLTRPWTIVTYGFLHGGFLHILFNCLWLFFFGRLFLEYFTPKQLLNFYLLGTLVGGIFYLGAYNYFPLFKGQVRPLVGASAGISAIVIGLAAYIPNYQLNFRFIGYVKIWHLAAFFIVLDLIGLAGSNGGGHFSHLGGALLGYLYVTQASNKKVNPFDGLFNIFKRKKRPLKTVYKSKGSRSKKTERKSAPKDNNQQRVDAILDKISKSGYDALSKEEKEFLFKQGK